MSRLPKVWARGADKQSVRGILCALALVAQIVGASEAVDKQREAAARMQESVRKQQGSVQRQSAVPAAAGGFFVLGWAAPSLVPASTIRPAASGDCDPVSEPELQSIIAGASEQHGVAANLIRAMITRESGGKPCAVSPKGAQGLMQLMPATQADLGVADPFDAVQNVDGGTRYIRQLLDRYANNMSLALAAYNAGPGRVDEKSGIPDIPETRGYVSAILSGVSEQ